MAPSAQGDAFADAWRNLRDREDIQFAEIEMPEAEPPPDWLVQFLEWLTQFFAPVGRALVAAWPVLMWVLIAAVLLAAAWLLYEIYGPGIRRRSKNEGKAEWMPEQMALALLEEADRLAAQGRYDEATHLLLQRSIGQIAQARPHLVEPSSTARELASEPQLPEAVRQGFASIAATVERSLFALRQLNEQDWLSARDAYARFALAQEGMAA